MTRSVDVIVPCYRYGRFLPQCTDSVLNQCDVNVRVLVIDDASPDDSAEVGSELARKDTRITFLRHAVNKGHIATYNEGLEWAKSEYSLLLSADDYLLPGALTRAVSLMENAPEVGFTFGNARLLLEDGRSEPLRPLHKVSGVSGHKVLSRERFIAYSGARNIVPTPTAVVRTNLQKDVGGYRSDLPHSGDMEMWLRLAAHAPVGFVDDFQAVYRMHGNNMSHAYSAGILPDLQQRKAAIDCFLQNEGAASLVSRQLRETLLRALGREAIKGASVAFNEEQLELCEEIRQFSVGVYPGIKLTLPWAKLACKRAMGVTGWRNIQSIRQSISRSM